MVQSVSPDWTAISSLNPQMQDPNTVYPGQVINVPGLPEFTTSLTARAAPASN